MVWLEAAGWARGNTPSGAVFAIKDAGLFRYFSGRRVVNLDGKANSAEYWRHVQSGAVGAYLSDVGVQYVGEINAGCVEAICIIRILVPKQPDVFLELHDRDQIYAGPPYPSRIGSFSVDETRIRIWRFRSQNG
jgi:hypothetical protein